MASLSSIYAWIKGLNRIAESLYLGKVMSCTKAVVAAFFVLLLFAGGSHAFGEIDSTYIIFHFHGTDTSFHLGANLNCLGDTNGDGFEA